METYILMCYKHDRTFITMEVKYATETEVINISKLLKQNEDFTSIAIINYSTDRITYILE